MALRTVFQKTTGRDIACLFGFTRSAHAFALPPASNQAIDSPSPPLPMSLPEHDYISDSSIGFRSPEFVSGGGSMELMAVPKKKTTKHKKRIRNAAKALKPIPVIVRCNNCGRVRLQHYYCCGGRKLGPDGN